MANCTRIDTQKNVRMYEDKKEVKECKIAEVVFFSSILLGRLVYIYITTCSEPSIIGNHYQIIYFCIIGDILLYNLFFTLKRKICSEVWSSGLVVSIVRSWTQNPADDWWFFSHYQVVVHYSHAIHHSLSPIFIMHLLVQHLSCFEVWCYSYWWIIYYYYFFFSPFWQKFLVHEFWAADWAAINFYFSGKRLLFNRS